MTQANEDKASVLKDEIVAWYAGAYSRCNTSQDIIRRNLAVIRDMFNSEGEVGG